MFYIYNNCCVNQLIAVSLRTGTNRNLNLNQHLLISHLCCGFYVYFYNCIAVGNLNVLLQMQREKTTLPLCLAGAFPIRNDSMIKPGTHAKGAEPLSFQHVTDS